MEPDSLGVHKEVDDGVESGIGHGEPEEGEEHVLSVGLEIRVLLYWTESKLGHLRRDVRVVVVDEVSVIWQPTHAKHNQDHNKHNAHLEHRYCLVRMITCK